MLIPTYVNEHFFEITQFMILFLTRLIFKINQMFKLTLNTLCVFFHVLNKKKYKIYWNLTLVYEKIIFSTTMLIKIIKKIATTQFKFKIYQNQKNLKKKLYIIIFKKIQGLNLLWYRLKKHNQFIKLITIDLSFSCIFWSNIWYTTYSKNELLVWWRCFNIRETELEYYDQFVTLFYSSLLFLKIKKIKIIQSIFI